MRLEKMKTDLIMQLLLLAGTDRHRERPPLLKRGMEETYLAFFLNFLLSKDDTSLRLVL